MNMSLNTVAFFLFAVAAVATAITTITRKNPVTAATFLITHFFCLSALYLTLQAQFLALLQILVYAGAIMVLVVFVIMLLNLGKEGSAEALSTRGVIGIALVGVLTVQVVAMLMGRSSGLPEQSYRAEIMGTVQGVGATLFSDYIFPFEAVSLLLLAAVVGSVMLAKRKLD
jgi:NADH-quinone oxidoreductase subunit J